MGVGLHRNLGIGHRIGCAMLGLLGPVVWWLECWGPGCMWCGDDHSGAAGIVDRGAGV